MSYQPRNNLPKIHLNVILPCPSSYNSEIERSDGPNRDDRKKKKSTNCEAPDDAISSFSPYFAYLRYKTLVGKRIVFLLYGKYTLQLSYL
jgi:hypothetical protein